MVFFKSQSTWLKIGKTSRRSLSGSSWGLKTSPIVFNPILDWISLNSRFLRSQTFWSQLGLHLWPISEVAYSIKTINSLRQKDKYCPGNALEISKAAHKYCAHRGPHRRNSESFLRAISTLFPFQILLLDLEISGRSNTIHQKAIISLKISAPS